MASKAIDFASLYRAIISGSAPPGCNGDQLLTIDTRTGKTYSLPIKNGTISGADLKQITAPSEKETDLAEHGLRVFDPGMDSTAVLESDITFINGYTGKMQYRGYDLEYLADNHTFMEVAYLFVHGELPTREQHAAFEQSITANFKVDYSVNRSIQAMDRSAPASGMAKVGLEALRATQQHLMPVHAGKDKLHGNEAAINKAALEIIAQQATIMSLVHCHKAGLEFRYPPAGTPYTEAVLYMMGIRDAVTDKVDPLATASLDRLFIAEADVDLNTGVFALYTATSTQNDPFAAISALISAAEGILHGNALELIVRDIAAIGRVDKIPAALDAVRARKARLMGFGGRRWKVADPRLRVAQAIIDTYMGARPDAVDPLVGVALELVKAVGKDDFFASRKIYPNADLLMSFAFRAIGFPAYMLYPMCVLARTPSMMAQFKNLKMKPVRMWLPSQVYVGKLDRNVQGADKDGVKAKL